MRRRLAWLVIACAACSSPQRAEPPPANAPPGDASVAEPAADAAAAPRDALATALLPPDAASGPVVIVTESDPCGLVMDKVYFAPGSSEIQPHQRQAADEMATMLVCMLKDTSITKLEVGGHADDTERDPQRISEERAVRIANLLVAKGLPARILKVVGYGNAQPIDRRKTAAARAKNRRVEFLILERARD